jgi:hypothetical protein
MRDFAVSGWLRQLSGIEFVPDWLGRALARFEKAAAGRLCGDKRFGFGRCSKNPAGFRWRGACMKSLITMIMLGVFSAAMVGCHAAADVGDSDKTDTTYQKKTTTTYDNGDRTVKTQTTVEKQ